MKHGHQSGPQAGEMPCGGREPGFIVGFAGAFRLLVAVLLAAYPVTVWAVPHGDSSTYNILASAGLVSFLLRRHGLVTREEKHLALALLCFFLITVVAWVVNGLHPATGGQVERYFLFTGGIAILYLVSVVRPPAAVVWWGGTLGAALMGVYALYMTRLGQVESLRDFLMIHSQVNYINFGQIALVNSCLSMVAIPYFSRGNRWAVVWPLVAFVLGLVAVGLSLTRGVWVALPALFVIMSWQGFRGIGRHKKLALTFGLAVLASAVVLLTNERVSKRFTEGVEQVVGYVHDNRAGTPVGARMEMYRVAWDIFVDNPFFGAGKGGYQETVSRLVEEGEVHPYVGQHSFPHSEFASQLAYHGLAGMAGLAVVLAVPTVVFVRRLSAVDTVRRRTGQAGLLLMVAYVHFMFTDSILEQRTTIIHFSLMVPLLTALGARRSPGRGKQEVEGHGTQ